MAEAETRRLCETYPEGMLIMLRTLLGALALVLTLALPRWADAHCQIPCGIYGDETRFTILEEHITTIEKSMKSIVELGAAEETNYNQIVRWVENKEHHADALASIVTEYFLQQRVKPMKPTDTPDWTAYTTKLNLCHRLLVHSMKAKQSTDLEQIEKLRNLVH